MGASAISASPQTADEAAATTRDSLTVAAWTAISRTTGLLRVVVVGAVLGPTYLGNAYQFTNSVPNLVYYGLLGGALVSSLLVPALVRHISGQDEVSTTRVARGFLGSAALAALAVVPLVGVGVPLVLHLGSGGAAAEVARAQVTVATVLVALLVPQIVCYAVIATSVAVMNARQRFALAAAAPTVENLGTIAVLGTVFAVYGQGREVTSTGPAELVLLGGGSTLAVVAHAALQWWGARRAGVTLRPTAGWRDPEVRSLLRRAGLATVQAGLWSAQVIVLMAFANRVAGGVVAVTIALNFFFLPTALAAAPIALAVLPRLAAHSTGGRSAQYDDATSRAESLAVFVAIPAAAGYVALAGRLTHAIAFGSMTDPQAEHLLQVALTGLGIGVIGHALVTVSVYASYARDDVRTPLRAMFCQAGVALSAMACSTFAEGTAALAIATGGLAGGTFVGAAMLARKLIRERKHRAAVLGSIGRAAVAAAAIAVPLWALDRFAGKWTGSRSASIMILVGEIAIGVVGYAFLHARFRSPELDLLRDAVRSGRSRSQTAGSAAAGGSSVQSAVGP